jgi:hypothetical protein
MNNLISKSMIIKKITAMLICVSMSFTGTLVPIIAVDDDIADSQTVSDNEEPGVAEDDDEPADNQDVLTDDPSVTTTGDENDEQVTTATGDENGEQVTTTVDENGEQVTTTTVDENGEQITTTTVDENGEQVTTTTVDENNQQVTTTGDENQGGDPNDEEPAEIPEVDIRLGNFPDYFEGMTIILTNDVLDKDGNIIKYTGTLENINTEYDNTYASDLFETGVLFGTYTVEIMSEKGLFASYSNVITVNEDSDWFSMSDSKENSIEINTPLLKKFDNGKNEKTKTNYYGTSGSATFYLEDSSILENFNIDFFVTVKDSSGNEFSATVQKDGGENGENDIVENENFNVMHNGGNCVVQYKKLTEDLTIECKAFYREVTKELLGENDEPILDENGESVIVSDYSESQIITIDAEKYSPTVNTVTQAKVNYNGTLTFNLNLEDVNLNYLLNGTYAISISDSDNRAIMNAETNIFPNKNPTVQFTIHNFKAVSSKTHSISISYTPDENAEKFYNSADWNDVLSITVNQIYAVLNTNYGVSQANGNSTPKDENGWYTSKITLAPLTLTNSPFDQIFREGDTTYAESTQGTNKQIVIEEETSDGEFKFFLRDSSTGEISPVETFKYKLDKTAPKVELETSENSDSESARYYYPKFTESDYLWVIDRAQTQYFYPNPFNTQPYKLISNDPNLNNQTIDKLFSYGNNYRYFLFQVEITEETSGLDLERINDELAKSKSDIKLSKISREDGEIYCFVIAIENRENGNNYGWDQLLRNEIPWIIDNVNFYDIAGNGPEDDEPKMDIDDEQKAQIDNQQAAVKISYIGDNYPTDANYSAISKNIPTNPDYYIYNGTAGIDFQYLNESRAQNINLKIFYNDFEEPIYNGNLPEYDLPELDADGNPVEKTALEKSGLSVDEDGRILFTKDGRYIVEITSPNGNGVIDSPDRQDSNNYKSVVHIIDNTEPVITEISYSEGLSGDIKKDFLSSVAETLSFGFYNPEKGNLIVTITAKDPTVIAEKTTDTAEVTVNDLSSGVNNFKWNFLNEDGSVYKSETIESSSITYNEDGTVTAELKLPLEDKEQYRGKLDFSVTDRAGNSSPETANEEKDLPGIIIDSIAPEVNISYICKTVLDEDGNIVTGGGVIKKVVNNAQRTDVTDAGADTRFIYNGAFNAVIEVKESNFFKSNEEFSKFADTNLKITVKHTIDGTETIDEDVEQNWTKNGDNWVTYIEFSEEGDYVVNVEYQDFSENEMNWTSEEYNQKGTYSYTSNVFTIDTTAPEIQLEFFESLNADGNPIAAANEISKNNRYATITITDRNFRPDKLDFVFSTANISDSDSLAEKALNDMKSKAVELSSWDNWTQNKTNPNVWTANLDFTEDAEYSFTLKCTDLADNSSEKASPKFTIDSTAPTEITIDYSQDFKNSILETITLGFYNPSVEVTITAKDETSGIASFRWIYTQEPGTSTEKNLSSEKGTISEVLPLNDGYATATFTLTADEFKQYRGNIQVFATDKAGNESDAFTDENDIIVIDTINPGAEISYSGDFKNSVVDDNVKNTVATADDTTRFIYDGDITATITITDANFFPQDFVNAKETEPDKTWQDLLYVTRIVDNVSEDYPIDVTKWTQDGDKWTLTFVLSGDGNYIVNIKQNDRSDNDMVWNSAEYENKKGEAEYQSNKLTIDTVDPTVNVEYSVTTDGKTEQAVLQNDVNYYNKNIKATITITDRNFRPDEIIANFNAQDVKGDNISEIEDVTALFATLNSWDSWTQSENDINVWQASLEFSSDANYDFTLDYEDLAENGMTQYKSGKFVIDHKAPTNLKISYSTPLPGSFLSLITFGYYQTSVTIEVTADDVTSGIDSFNYFYIKEDGSSDINKDNLDGIISQAEFITSDEEKMTKTASFTLKDAQYRGNIKFSATDKAGNASDELDDTKNKTVVVDNISPDRTITYSAPKQIVDKTTMDNKTVDFNAENTNSIFYYNNTATATIKIEEANFYPQDISLKVNNQDYPIGWQNNGNDDVYIAEITFSEDGDYIIDMSYTDRSTNEMKVYKSEQITVDTIAPKVETQYSESNIVRSIGGRDYYGSDQTVTVKITERNFRAEDVNVELTATDAGGDSVATALISSIKSSLKNRSNWRTSGNVHTATITYSDDANYTFDISYTDLADNGLSTDYKEDLFTVDTTAPGNLNIAYSTSVFSNVLNMITFGYYNEKVTVTISAEDTTSGVFGFDYSAVLTPNVSSVNQEIVRQGISETSISHSNGRRRATATFDIPYSALTSTTQFDGNVNFSASDRSGKNTSFADTANRIIVDNISPTANVTYNEPFQTVNNIAYYSGEITASIRITEANFYSSDVNVAVTRNGSAYPATVLWRDNNVNEHIGTFTLTSDGDYSVNVSYTDRSKNLMNTYQSGKMIIDTVKPTVVIEGIKNNSANNAEVIGFTISSSDENFDPNKFTPVITVVAMNEDGGFETKQIPATLITDISGKKYSYVIENLNADGVYTVTCDVTDLSGNNYKEFVIADSENSVSDKLTFSVNRSGSTFALDENTIKLIDTYYVQSVENDIVVFETNVDPLEIYGITLKLGSKETVLKEGTDFTVTESSSDDEWEKYTYKINKSLFEEEGEYKIVITSKDKADNDAYSDIKNAEINFIVDKTSPTLSISGIKSNGIYSVNEKIVSIIPRDDGGKLDSISITVLNNKGKETDSHNWNKDFLAKSEENGESLSFNLSKGYNQSVHIVSIDYAGNSTKEIYYFDNVTISTNRFVTFYADKTLFWIVVIGALTAIGGVILTVVLLKRRKRKLNS